ncbi:hypothetical protein DID88_008817 [Monilinia fructigena]|uniref:Amino acid transporter transmembrane domain-containing protein n=1 Tax=Monilinia fructigena TaxID=38457 RepID=A0A395J6Z4_9HELO|nr:hypothetical protein DID88_008817 [Monilinia fructigena]
MSTPSSSQALPVPMGSSPSPGSFRGRSGSPSSRDKSTARLASPVPSHQGTPQVRQIPTPNQVAAADSSESLTPPPLAGAGGPASYAPGPGISALAAALSNSIGQTPPTFGTPPIRPLSPAASGKQIQGTGVHSNYGSVPRSIQGGSGWAGPTAYEDPEIIKRHLVQPGPSQLGGDGATDGIFGLSGQSPSFRAGSPASTSKQAVENVAPGLDDDEFSSLRLQGGDVTRPIYRWTEDAHRASRSQRSKSFHISRPEAENEVLDIGTIKVPGGFRRNYLRRAAGSPTPDGLDTEEGGGLTQRNPRIFTNNFLEFLTIYGHFAGEELEEDDEVLGPDEYFGSDAVSDEYGDGSDDDREPMENSALLTPGRRKRKRKERAPQGTTTPFQASLLLLKSFVGTGVLFLPKAYLNGGMLFSNIILLFVAALSYYCFVLLVNTRLKVEASFGDMGGVLYGRWMRTVILASIVVSQIGFVAAYIVFTSENLQAFIAAVSDCRAHWEVSWLILLQMAIFLPFSLLRDISKLGFTALVADAFILAVSRILSISISKTGHCLLAQPFLLSKELVLIIPIQESMKNPKKFPPVLGLVMIIITVVSSPWVLSLLRRIWIPYRNSCPPQPSPRRQDGQWCSIPLFVRYSFVDPLTNLPSYKNHGKRAFHQRAGNTTPIYQMAEKCFPLLRCCPVRPSIAYVGSNDLDKFVSIVGSFACIPLVFIYPPMLHYRGVAKTRFRKGADILLCVFGLVVMVYTTALTISRMRVVNVLITCKTHIPQVVGRARAELVCMYKLNAYIHAYGWMFFFLVFYDIRSLGILDFWNVFFPSTFVYLFKYRDHLDIFRMVSMCFKLLYRGSVLAVDDLILNV